eukprot:29005-Eustigmatos_ZCMA.PRE.1
MAVPDEEGTFTVSAVQTLEWGVFMFHACGVRCGINPRTSCSMDGHDPVGIRRVSALLTHLPEHAEGRRTAQPTPSQRSKALSPVRLMHN